MKKRLILICACAASLAAIVGCKEEPQGAAKEAETTTQAPETPAMSAEHAASSGPGTVLETMDASGYTYVRVDLNGHKVWAAAPQFSVSAGDEVVLPSGGTPMTNYHSKTLDRTFELIYFLPSIGGKDASTAAAPAAHGQVKGQPAPTPAAAVDLSGIDKIEGGQTVEEAIAGKADLSGKEIAIRGKVVKFSAGIMGKNWLHLQDGTGASGANDLTVTTDAMAAAGDLVVVRGKLTTDKDFGSGYFYPVIVEDASVTKD